MKSKSERFPVPKARWECQDYLCLPSFLLNWKQKGRASAIAIAKARKGDDAALFNVNEKALKKVKPDFLQRLREIYGEEWKPTPWKNEAWFKPEPWHFCHVSTVDPTQVAYYPTLRHLMDRREVRTRPGRYLTKYFPDQDAKHWAEMMSARTIQFVEDDDKEGWEWVYEHPYSFNSCMSFKAWGDYTAPDPHPCSIYARKGNGLRLAWIGNGFKSDEGQVFARAIVRGKEYVRVYGDDTLHTLLQAQGFTQNKMALLGAELEKVWDDGRIICPYLDGNNKDDKPEIEIRDDHLLVVEDGYKASRTDGYLNYTCITCEDCGCMVDEDNSVSVGEYEDRRVCESCLGRNYTAAVGRSGHEYFVPDRDAVAVGGQMYHTEYLDENGIYECCGCGEHLYRDNVYTTKEGVACEDCCTYLDYEDSRGNCYAIDSQVAEDPDGDNFLESEGREDAITEETWHKSVMTQLASGEWVHESTMQEHPYRFLHKDDGIYLVPVPAPVPVPEMEPQIQLELEAV